jgi:hypothetical protein
MAKYIILSKVIQLRKFLNLFRVWCEKEHFYAHVPELGGTGRRDGTQELETRDGTGLSKKNDAGWDGTRHKSAGYGTGRDDFLVVPRSSVSYDCAITYLAKPMQLNDVTDSV